MKSLKTIIRKILKEQFENMTPKIGDRLLCTKPVFNLETKQKEFRKGKTYIIEKVSPSKILLRNEFGEKRLFGLEPSSPLYYGDYFYLVHQEEIGF